MFICCREFASQPFSIKRVGCHAVTCLNSEGEMCLLFVSVIKHSSVVRQVNLIIDFDLNFLVN